MKRYVIQSVSEYKNAGQACQQDLDYALTGLMRKADHIPFDMDSDIPEFNMSVKSAKFTLVSARRVHGETFDEIWNEYARRVHSTRFAYVSIDRVVYEMNLDEFKSFVYTFGFLSVGSGKEKENGAVIRCKSESKKMRIWLENMAQRA